MSCRELTDVINTLQGLFILIIFLRQKKKRHLVHELIESWLGNAGLTVERRKSEETSSTNLSSGINMEKPEKSDKGTNEGINQLSTREESV